MGRVFTTVTIGGIKCKKSVRALIDTGADLTLVDEKIASKVGLNPTHETQRVQVGNKEWMDVPIFTGSFVVKGLKKNVALLGVIDLPERVLLGHDIMETLPGELTVKGRNLMVSNRRKGLHV